MNILDVLKLECCEPDLHSKDKDEALKKIAELMKRSSVFNGLDSDKIYTSLKEREDMGSTGFGRGIAIPHCQMDEIDKFVIGIAICKKGVSYDAIDKKKVKIFIIIIGPTTNRNGHLSLLAKVSHTLKEPDVPELLQKANTKITLYEEFLRNTDSEGLKVSKKKREKLMIVIVKDEEIMQDVTEVFIEYGVQESTIIETQQMENLLSKVPLFLGFFNFTGGKSPYSKIILLKISKEYINPIIKGLEDIFGDLDSFSGLSVMVLDLFFAKGF